jgi:hypothetical protein
MKQILKKIKINHMIVVCLILISILGAGILRGRRAQIKAKEEQGENWAHAIMGIARHSSLMDSDLEKDRDYSDEEIRLWQRYIELCQSNALSRDLPSLAYFYSSMEFAIDNYYFSDTKNIKGLFKNLKQINRDLEGLIAFIQGRPAGAKNYGYSVNHMDYYNKMSGKDQEFNKKVNEYMRKISEKYYDNESL